MATLQGRSWRVRCRRSAHRDHQRTASNRAGPFAGIACTTRFCRRSCSRCHCQASGTPDPTLSKCREGRDSDIQRRLQLQRVGDRIVLTSRLGHGRTRPRVDHCNTPNFEYDEFCDCDFTVPTCSARRCRKRMTSSARNSAVVRRLVAFRLHRGAVLPERATTSSRTRSLSSRRLSWFRDRICKSVLVDPGDGWSAGGRHDG